MEIHKDYCSKCKIKDVPLIKNNKGVNKDGTNVQYYRCRPCANDRFKNYYNRNKERVRAIIYKSIAKHKEKQDSRSALWRAINTGKITKPTTCSSCKAKGKIEGHHEDYLKPLEVIWLCTGCHGDADRKLHNIKEHENI